MQIKNNKNNIKLYRNMLTYVLPQMKEEERLGNHYKLNYIKEFDTQYPIVGIKGNILLKIFEENNDDNYKRLYIKKDNILKIAKGCKNKAVSALIEQCCDLYGDINQTIDFRKCKIYNEFGQKVKCIDEISRNQSLWFSKSGKPIKNNHYFLSYKLTCYELIYMKCENRFYYHITRHRDSKKIDPNISTLTALNLETYLDMANNYDKIKISNQDYVKNINILSDAPFKLVLVNERDKDLFYTIKPTIDSYESKNLRKALNNMATWSFDNSGIFFLQELDNVILSCATKMTNLNYGDVQLKSYTVKCAMYTFKELKKKALWTMNKKNKISNQNFLNMLLTYYPNESEDKENNLFICPALPKEYKIYQRWGAIINTYNSHSKDDYIYEKYNRVNFADYTSIEGIFMVGSINNYGNEEVGNKVFYKNVKTLKILKVGNNNIHDAVNVVIPQIKKMSGQTNIALSCQLNTFLDSCKIFLKEIGLLRKLYDDNGIEVTNLNHINDEDMDRIFYNSWIKLNKNDIFEPTMKWHKSNKDISYSIEVIKNYYIMSHIKNTENYILLHKIKEIDKPECVIVKEYHNPITIETENEPEIAEPNITSHEKAHINANEKLKNKIYPWEIITNPETDDNISIIEKPIE
ncbi:hypothetical protein A3Q56_02602 [Intoshia linei]|uniref:Doublecortin domain-containing protein n=1 Tax=Intoshia linei TaxID=1819745 RepID=A0A177B7N9_9BILA|nr:hypothetical protein A3Q56_02602 [Intoshia linei]